MSARSPYIRRRPAVSVITILGAGVMGSAMCLPARARGHEVRLVGTHLDTAIIDSVARHRVCIRAWR